jgi:hypothetical protein
VGLGRARKDLLARVADESELADMKEMEREEDEEGDRHASREAHGAKDVVKRGNDGSALSADSESVLV